MRKKDTKTKNDLIDKMSDFANSLGGVTEEERIIIEEFRANRDRQANTMSVSIDVSRDGKRRKYEYNSNGNEVLVPKEVDAFLQEYQVSRKKNIREGFEIISIMALEYPEASEWINANPDTFAKAWLNGWEIIPDPIYITRAPNPSNPAKSLFLVMSKEGKAALIPMDDIKEDDRLTLTKDEIEKDFSWFLSLRMAEEVTDEVVGLSNLKKILEDDTSEKKLNEAKKSEISA